MGRFFFKTSNEKAHAHCDGPCVVYDPAQARVAAEAVLSMTKKIVDLEMPTMADKEAMQTYQNTMSRYIAIKEDEAHKTKEHLLVLWTDYFKPDHLEAHPNLHDVIWNATKTASACKQEVSLEHAQELLDYVKQVHEIFWATKGREVEWVLATG